MEIDQPIKLADIGYLFDQLHLRCKCDLISLRFDGLRYCVVVSNSEGDHIVPGTRFTHPELALRFAIERWDAQTLQRPFV